MRAILRKIERNHQLAVDEYQRLMEYIDDIMHSSPDTYALIYDRYSRILAVSYHTFLPRFAVGIDDLINFTAQNPEVIKHINSRDYLLSNFPPALQPYLLYLFTEDPQRLSFIWELLGKCDLEENSLPHPRRHPIAYKFEDQNPYKEIGLKAHFDRLSKYSFVTRLQSYRYLTRNKTARDRIEYLAPDKLGGIFTNKDKSIYYYIFLSQADKNKAEQACRLLNTGLYGLK